MTKYANDHPYKLVVGEGDGIYANDHPYLVEIDGGVVTPEEFEELEKKVDALATDLSYKGGVPTYDDLPADPEQGDVYTVEDTGVLYVWDGDEWVALNETKEPYKTLTADDYNYPTTGTKTSIAPWLLEPGLYVLSKGIRYTPSYNSSSNPVGHSAVLVVGEETTTDNKRHAWWIGPNDTSDSATMGFGIYSESSGGGVMARFNTFPNGTVDNLTSSSRLEALSANQGRILNGKIGDLSTLTTTAKTSAVAAINELDSDKEGKTITGSAAPTISTVADNVGQKYYDSTNDKWYVCKAIEEESGGGFSYIWEEQGGGPNVVQTTGTSTTDVMSQKAVSSKLFHVGSTSIEELKVQLGYDANSNGVNGSVAIGRGKATGDKSVAISSSTMSNESATASGAQAIAIGNSAMASGVRGIAIGGSANPAFGAFAGGANSVAFGYDTKANYQSSISFSQSYARHKGQVQFEINGTTAGYTEGYNNSRYRLVSGLYDPQSAHDAANKQYVDANSATTLTNSQFNSILENA